MPNKKKTFRQQDFPPKPEVPLAHHRVPEDATKSGYRFRTDLENTERAKKSQKRFIERKKAVEIQCEEYQYRLDGGKISAKDLQNLITDTRAWRIGEEVPGVT
ncbi:hypothetical protein K435DRAFT_873894 [Dendrothele bispora CBS 962.96]|uniref:Uncharacterized protein n=1 Tax=Dendrothele bispora (strain CBS 962.96) TaxID=1314807 RepID=A0A4S8KY11_DENBC|nr:hypothetical protein K435DRAFT_873894 [Dendrothele bispora CBS 962.96]